MQKTLVAMTFAFGLMGGAALATGIYQATATETASAGALENTLGGGATVIGGLGAPAPGHWILTNSGRLTWVLDSDTTGRAPGADWSGERGQRIADIDRGIECQINGCDAP